MSKQTNEILSGQLTVTALSVPLTINFQAITSNILAGGPIEIEASVENNGSLPVSLFVAGDMIKARPAHYSFDALLNEYRLTDSKGEAPYLGGPQGCITVSTEEPFKQVVILNDYLKLEDTQKLIEPGANEMLQLTCKWHLKLSVNPNASSYEYTHAGTVPLAIALLRDDEKLREQAALLHANVISDPSDMHSLNLLLSMRSAATAEIQQLINHPDPIISARSLAVYNSIS